MALRRWNARRMANLVRKRKEVEPGTRHRSAGVEENGRMRQTEVPIVEGREAVATVFPEVLIFYPKLSDAGLRLYLAYNAMADNNGVLWWGRSKLAFRLGWSEDRVKAAHAELLRAKLIAVRRFRIHPRTNEVIVNISTDESCLAFEERMNREDRAFMYLTTEDRKASQVWLLEWVREVRADRAGRVPGPGRGGPRARRAPASVDVGAAPKAVVGTASA